MCWTGSFTKYFKLLAFMTILWEYILLVLPFTDKQSEAWEVKYLV